jgi:hypothetical protein
MKLPEIILDRGGNHAPETGSFSPLGEKVRMRGQSVSVRYFLNEISRFEPLNHLRHSIEKTLEAFLPLRVGGVCEADGERAGVRCSSHHFGLQGEASVFFKI